MKLRTLPLTLALMAAFSGHAQAQSLSQLLEAAKAHDATYKSARSQFDASLALSLIHISEPTRPY